MCGPDQIAEYYIKGIKAGSGLKDGASALSEAVQGAKAREKADCERGEAPYRPYSTTNDKVATAKPSRNGVAHDRRMSDEMLDTVRTEASYLRARLRAVFRALQDQTVTHGVRKGSSLSDRMLTESAACIRGGRVPDRAYQRAGEVVDTTVAASIVVDQSGSMNYSGGEKLRYAAQGAMLVADALDALGCPVEVSGFRDGKYDYEAIRGADNHRVNGVNIDIFKGFDERLNTVKHRFAALRGEGGTPMADGIQHGLQSLSDRKEGHRILFVFTDGQPDAGHEKVIRRQLRLAREAGIHIIGVGIGHDAAYVTTLFDDHVYAQAVSELPKMLIGKLNSIVDTKRVKVNGNNRRMTAA